MTRDERIARANEIFDMVYGDESKRAGEDVLWGAISDVIGWAEMIEQAATNSPEHFNDHAAHGDWAGGLLDELSATARGLREVATRLESIDLDGDAR